MDLRCHGESVGLADAPAGPHTVHTAASDIITLLRNLKLFPRTLIGHSFGGKVVMSMTQQFGMVLPRPVQVRRGRGNDGWEWREGMDVRWQTGGCSQPHTMGGGAASASLK